jgi:hypothetical protein
MKGTLPQARTYAPGIGDAVADRTVNRMITVPCDEMTLRFEIPRDDTSSLESQLDNWVEAKGNSWDGKYEVEHGDGDMVTGTVTINGIRRRETWEEVAARVSEGSASLGVKGKPGEVQVNEFDALHHHMRQASTLLSGRHLQHGDATQSTRPMEVFTNCATAATSAILFRLLLNGAGVGRDYSDDMMAIDYANMPIVVPVIAGNHPDVMSGEINAVDQRTAKHQYAAAKKHIFMVPDTREGWAQAIEMIEGMAHLGDNRDTVLILDFSNVRERGAPIAGMQGRPASGPGPLMSAIEKISKIRNAQMPRWKQALYIDHFLAECVLVGGARRAARMATKHWTDPGVSEFIRVKRPIEYDGLTDGESIMKVREEMNPDSFLWSSNNSITTDKDFWGYVRDEKRDDPKMQAHAMAVFNDAVFCGFFDGTGEPGFINVDMLEFKEDGLDEYLDAEFQTYATMPQSVALMRDLANRFRNKPYKVITNPCGEIVLVLIGAYCVIGDVVPYHSQSDDDAEDAFRVTVRALVRTNLMDCLYKAEVNRTNRIGVSMTGIHEYALARFGYGWKDIVDEVKSKDFWMMLARFARAVRDESIKYANEMGVTVPHTSRTIKPAGTTSKLFGLSEGAHLPAMREYLRWVQFRNDDPLVAEYEAKGYPVKKLKVYDGTTVVGFPTRPEICRLATELGMEDKVVTAAEATPAEQFEYLRLLEKYWIVGVEEDGLTAVNDNGGNQVSYTLKYDPKVVSYEEFRQIILDNQSTVRCCSVMPQEDTSAYEYLPEEAVTKHEYELIAEAIQADGQMKEEVGFEHVDCGSGGCPVDFNEDDKAA